MKACIINVNNCIDFSQYGPFLFENIKNGDCVVYNSIKNTEELGKIYEEILTEYNRNAFGSGKVKLLLIIPRNMDAPGARDYEIYNEINIYTHVTSKFDIFSEISVIYVDECHETVEGVKHKLTKTVTENKFSEDESLSMYLPVLSTGIDGKKKLSEAVGKIGNPLFKAFFERAVSDIPDDVERDYKDQFMNSFAMYCARLLPSVRNEYQLINKNDVSDSIRKKLRVVYYIKHLAKSGAQKSSRYEDFNPDYDQIKREIATYKQRLSSWLDGMSRVENGEIKTIRAFTEQKNAPGFVNRLVDIISKDLIKFEKINFGEEDAVDEIFERFARIIETADEALEAFSKGDVEAYFDKSNYFSKSIETVDDDKLTESYEKELTKKLNPTDIHTLPGSEARENLHVMLDVAKKKVEDLFLCKQNYFFRLFMSTLVFALISVGGLYLLAQYSVFVKEHSFDVYAIYFATVAVNFFLVYIYVALRYKREIKRILKRCRKELRLFLEHYQILATDFEKNLNLMASICCLREFLNSCEAVKKEAEVKKDKLEWHKSKTKDILDNFSHFNDFVKGQMPVPEEIVTPSPYDDDEIHTEFYQVKIF